METHTGFCQAHNEAWEGVRSWWTFSKKPKKWKYEAQRDKNKDMVVRNSTL